MNLRKTTFGVRGILSLFDHLDGDYCYTYDHHWDAFLAYPREHYSEKIKWAVFRDDGVILAYTSTKRRAKRIQFIIGNATVKRIQFKKQKGKRATFTLRKWTKDG